MLLKTNSSYPLTIWSKVLGHFAGLKHNITDSMLNADTEVTNSNRPETTPRIRTTGFDLSIAEESEVYQDIVRMWVLRILIPLDGHLDFIGKGEFRNHGIAKLLNLKDSNRNHDSRETIAVELALQQALKLDQEESLTVLKPHRKSENKFCPDTVLSQLNVLYRKSEYQIDTLALPEPLAGNLQRLTSLLGLSPVEYWILAFTILLTTHQELIDAYGFLSGKRNKRRFRKNLSVILGFSTVDIRIALSGQSVLFQTSLVRWDYFDSELTTLSSDFAERLTIEYGMPLDWLRDMITPSAPPQLSLTDYPHLKETLYFLLPYLAQSLSNARKGVNVLIHGVPGTGKTQLTRVLAAKLAYPLYEVATIDKEGDPRSGESRLRVSLAAQVIFHRQPFLMLFDEAEDVFKHHERYGSVAQTRKAWTNSLLEENSMPVFWVCNSIEGIDPAFIRRFDWIIHVPVPPKTQREQIIRNHCGDLLSGKAIKRIAASDELAPAVITRTASVMNLLADQFSVEQLSSVAEHLMDTTLKAQGHKGLNLKQGKPLSDFYDPGLVNCDTDLKRITEGIQRYGNARLCLFGPPGTGKTAWSYWLAEQLNKPLHIKRCSDLLSMWLGDSEQKIAKAFQEAEAENAVLLIDEVDSFLLDRSLSQRSWEFTRVNEILTQMESYHGVLIATTNRMESLDSASLRRFDLKVKFDMLKPSQAWKLLKSYCQVLGLPEPDDSAQDALEKVDNLTLGDFAVLERQHRFNALVDAQAVIKALQAECVLKTPQKQRAIGFV
jgi:transitional endoplasmic reticulum ATPase